MQIYRQNHFKLHEQRKLKKRWTCLLEKRLQYMLYKYNNQNNVSNEDCEVHEHNVVSATTKEQCHMDAKVSFIAFDSTKRFTNCLVSTIQITASEAGPTAHDKLLIKNRKNLTGGSLRQIAKARNHTQSIMRLRAPIRPAMHCAREDCLTVSFLLEWELDNEPFDA